MNQSNIICICFDILYFEGVKYMSTVVDAMHQRYKK